MDKIEQPKVFISYSWSSLEHQELVKNWAERLVGDGVDVVIDIYDLKEGDDKYEFMERMVTDPTVTHVLVMCDEKYSLRADAREAGVGTESQIISKQVYQKVSQSKFIPIICQKDDAGEAYTPVFMASRIYIDFSTPESVNDNWERLVRLLYGKPEHVKPALGKAPSYITDVISIPATKVNSKYLALRNAIHQEKKRLKGYRSDFLDECVIFTDSLRVREQPSASDFGQEVLRTLHALEPVKNSLLEWVLLESEADFNEDFAESLIGFLEQLASLKGRPQDLRQWSDNWFEAHDVFVYEVFLYIVAALLKNESFETLKEVFSHRYLQLESGRAQEFRRFDCFYGYSEALQVLSDQGGKLKSPAARYIKDHASNKIVGFNSIMEAELLVLMMSFITGVRWFPQTLYYAEFHARFNFFARLASTKKVEKIKCLTGYQDIEQLKLKIRHAHDSARHGWNEFYFVNFMDLMNLQRWGEHD